MKTLLSSLKYSLKVFAKNKFHLFLILVCLIVSLSFFYIILQKAYNDSLYNNHFSGEQSVSRLTTYYDAYEVASSSNKLQVFKTIKEQVPEINKGAAVKLIQPKIVGKSIGEERICENFFLMEKNALDILGIQLTNNAHHYPENGEIFLSRQQALKLFNRADVIGKTISITFNNSNYELIIGGVFSDFKKLSTFSPRFIASFESIYRPEQKDPLNSEFFVTTSTEDVAGIENKINELGFAEEGMVFQLQSLDDIYFHSSDLINDFHKKGNYQFYKISLLISAVLLVFGFLNFLSLIVSFYIQRIKEFYIRKVNGSTGGNFASLFFVELSVLFFIALLVAGVGISLLRTHHSFQIFTETYLNISQKMVLLLTVLGIVVFLISITAVVLKKTILNRYFKGYWNYTSHRGSRVFNKIFQVLQLSVVLLLIIFIATVTKQINYSFSGVKGYDHQNLMQANFPVFSGESKYDVVKQKLLAYPGILAVSGSYGAPMNDASFFMSLTSKADNKKVAFEAKAVCPDYFNVLGASFANKINSETLINFSESDILVNETGYQMLGLHDASGEIVDGYKVKGVVHNINHKTASNKVPPKLYMIAKEPISTLLIKHDGEKTSQEYKKIIENEYLQVFPDFNSDIKSYDRIFAHAYASEVQLRDFLSVFLVVMLLLTLLGFFSIVNYDFIKNAKTMAINKVLGAGVPKILGKQACRWLVVLLISSFVSTLLGYYLSVQWLQTYFYKITTSSFIYLFSILIGLVIIVVTMLFFMRKVARMDVCKVMKEEE